MRNLTPAKVTLIMLFVVGGLIVAYIAKTLLAVEAPPPTDRTRNVPMAISDIEPGTIITEQHLGMGPYPVKLLKPDMLLNNRVIAGRVSKEKIKAATPIRTPQLYQHGERPALEIGKGMRAKTIDISGSAAIVDGLFKPGQYIDIHLTPTQMTSDPRMQGGMTMTLCKGVRVLAINRNFQQGQVDRGSNAVTLELTPAQVNIVTQAEKSGQLMLTYTPEGPGDGGVSLTNADRATLEEILGLSPIPEPEPPAPPFMSEYFSRGGRTVFQFRDGIRIEGGSLPPTAPRPQDPVSTPRSASPMQPIADDVPDHPNSNPQRGTPTPGSDDNFAPTA